MNIKEFGEILKQLNKVPIDYKDDAGIEMFMKRNYNEKKFDDGYYYNRNLVPIFSWNLSDDVRLRAIKDIDILRKREPYIFLTTFTSDSVPKYPIVICDKVIDNEELFAIRNDVEPKIFIEKFNKTSLHYFKIKIKDAKENNIGNDDVKTFNKNIKKLKDWFWGNDIDRDKTESFIDEVTSENTKENKLIWEGATWAITFNYKTKRIKNTIGMHIIAHLIKYQGDMIMADKIYYDIVADNIPKDKLYSGVDISQLNEHENISVESDSDIDDPLEFADMKSIDMVKDYKKAIEQKLEQAEMENDNLKIKKVEFELKQIVTWLNQTTDKYGKPRQIPNRLEKSRKAIIKTVNTAKRNIKKYHTNFFDHLNENLIIRTESYYKPNVDVSWTVEK